MIGKLEPEGTVRIPQELLEALGLKDGDDLTIRLDDGGIRIVGLKATIQRIQTLVKEAVPDGVSLSESLIKERKHVRDA